MIYFFFKPISLTVFSKFIVLFVTFYVLFWRLICLTQSSDFVIHTNKDSLNELGSRQKNV